jgi:hypothetical protein
VKRISSGPSAVFLYLAVLVPLSLQANITPISLGLYNTGVDDSGNVLGALVTDPHYTVVSDPIGPTTPSTDRATALVEDPSQFPFGYWAPDNATSAWISQYPANSSSALNNGSLDSQPDGLYDYRTTFNLTATQAKDFILTGGWSTDNEGFSILINGTTVGASISEIPPGYNTFDTFPAGTFTISSGFQAGVNTLDFVVQNDVQSYGNPTGLRAEFTSATPEPGVYGILALGMSGLLLLVRRKRQAP